MGKCSNRKDLAHSPTLGALRQWRTLDELAATPAFEKLVHDEFPHTASIWPDGQSRREFLKVMGASMALAGLASCTRKADEKLVPYVKQPEWMVPGKPLYFASVATLGGYAKGVLVESYDGRPIKIEGNPDHPASPRRESASKIAYGASDALTQASVLNLYDPNRSAVVLHIGVVSDYNGFTQAIYDNLAAHPDGKGISILTEAISSPTLLDQISRFQKKYPQAKWHTYEPLWPQNSREGVQLAFGRALDVVYSLDKAKVIVSLDNDFLNEGPGNLVYAAQFIDGRRVRSDWVAAQKEMNRLFVAESTTTSTGAMADVRVRLKPSDLEKLAWALAGAVGGNDNASAGLNDKQASWVKLAAAALQRSHGTSIVMPGESLSPAAHAAIHKMNADLGNQGQTVRFIEPVVAQPAANANPSTLGALVADMNAGAVSTLFILGGNPVYNAPTDLDFAGAMNKVDFRVHLGSHYDETGFNCHWHIPLSHELESWGDARAFEGTASIIQPLIAPLHASKSAIELFSILLGEYDREAHAIVRQYWMGAKKDAADFDGLWFKSLNDGVIADTAFATQDVQIAAAPQAPTAPAAAGAYELVFRADPCIYDGRFATNGWLQELPKPMTKLTWDNAAVMSPATATALDVEFQDRVKLTAAGRTVTAAVFVVPGHPDGVITTHLGYGRTKAWKIGDAEEDLAECGFNAYLLRTSTTMSWAAATVEKTGGKYALASTQLHQLMEGREPIKVLHLDDAAQPNSDKPEEPGETLQPGDQDAPQRRLPLSLYPEVDYSKEPNKWGMVIDQNACIGCNACMIACQAENNSPVVGKYQVALGRHMHWIRVDAYYAGDNDADPAGPFFQPLPCMHCEKAPCEVVCPVNATVHDNEGLNLQVYNRCVGTRYCANNCPYKVRRFNFLEYDDRTTDLLKLVRNPEVTVRSRGIMEKCNYCLQRISRARIEAKKQFRDIKDGEVLTACQQACPTSAIIFGNLHDETSQIAQVVTQPQNYSLLDELQTVPRTTYLPRYTNELKGVAPYERSFEAQEGDA